MNSKKRRYRIAHQRRNSEERMKRSDLDRRFGFYFRKLAKPSINDEDDEVFNSFYTSHEYIEKQLQIFLEESDEHKMFVGARGSGKSTYIRKIFGSNSKPHLLQNDFVIPLSLDSRELESPEKVRQYFVQALRASVNALNFTNINVLSSNDFASFLNERDPTLLFTDPEIHDMSDVTKNLTGLKKNDPLAFNCYFCAFLCKKHQVESVSIILDGMEFGNFDIALSACKLCLIASKQFRSVEIVCKILCCCRPVTFHSLKAHAAIDGFPFSDPLTLEQPKPLLELLDKRFESLMNIYGKARLQKTQDKAHNLVAWKEAYNVLHFVAQNFSDRSEDALVKLCNYDVRQAFLGLAQILKNAQWYEDNENLKQGSFKIHIEDYRANEAGFWRALLLGDQKHYEDGDNPYFFNIFRNESDPATNFEAVCFIRYFYSKGRERRIFKTSPDNLQSDLADILGTERIRVLTEWAIDRDILYSEVGDLKGDGVNSKLLVPLPKLFYMWTWLGRSAVPFEFLRDDTFIEHSKGMGAPNFMKGGTSMLKGEVLFQALADFLDHLCKEESIFFDKIIQQKSQEKLAKFYKITSTSGHIFKGYTRSIERYFKVIHWEKGPLEIVQRAKEIKERISVTEESFNKSVGEKILL